MSHASAHSPLYCELTLPEMLADPIIRAVTARDGVTKRDLESLIGSARDRMTGRQMERYENGRRRSESIAFNG
jgi:hypothetical protein